MANPRPSQPDLEQLKKQAKDLLKAHKSADLDAARRIKSLLLSKYSARSEQEILDVSFSLREAQQIIAREHGFSSWQKLKASVDAVAEGKLVYKLTTPEELTAVLGPPDDRTESQDGGMSLLTLKYGGTTAKFGKMREYECPFTLLQLEGYDIGQNKPVILRGQSDLDKFDSFWGFAGLSMVNVDLSDHQGMIDEMPYDTRTEWPPPDRLPEGFDPQERLDRGKTPGLGIRELNAQGKSGQGIGIAIIDQPLLRDHVEYVDRIVHYESIEIPAWIEPQMHGPPVASIAVGKTCGVAPQASLYYYAVPAWKWKACAPYAKALENIIDASKSMTTNPIKVVSISLGMFSHWDDFELWQAAVQEAERHGILVVTCDKTFLNYGTSTRIPGKKQDDPNSYLRGRHSSNSDVLRIPTGHRTTVSHQGKDVYTYYTNGGMSWAAPYLAGLAALAFQVDPNLEPGRIVPLWLETATSTSAGHVVNPKGFIDLIQNK
jgi:serine protease AprX